MHSAFNTKAAKTASTEPATITEALPTAESKAISLHTMTTALSELLEGPFEEKLSPYARRLQGACYQVAWAIEEMAEGMGGAIREALDAAYALRTDTDAAAPAPAKKPPLRTDREADAVVRQVQHVRGFACSRDEMIGFTDELLTIIDELSVSRLALMNTDWHSPEAIDSIAAIVDRSFERANVLQTGMSLCFDNEGGRAAVGGAA